MVGSVLGHVVHNLEVILRIPYDPVGNAESRHPAMNVLDTRVYRWLETATDFFLLNLMWLAACLPVVTIFPSTAAMFGVVRDWVRGKEGSLTRTFITRFRENLGQSLLVGAIWTVFGVALFLDFLVANQLSYWAEIVLKSLLVLVSTLYAFGSVYLFPVMVHYETDWKTVIKNSVLMSIGRLPTTLMCLAFLVVMVGLTVVVPFLVVITGSITAYVVYRLCDREFRKIDAAHGDV
jgi:uncharacterized membrane protein YesL